MEMSFVGEEDMMDIAEGMMATLFKDVLGMDLNTPFERLTYDEAVGRFGLDKPDIRFGLELEGYFGHRAGLRDSRCFPMWLKRAESSKR